MPHPNLHSAQVSTIIPIIDFAPFLQGNRVAKQRVAEQIYHACHEFGFLYLIHHRIRSAQIEALLLQAKLFFDQPLAVKNQVRRSPQTNCGYVPMQSERLNPNRPGDLKEAFNVGDQTVWPTNAEVFRQVVSQFYQTSMAEALLLLQAFALALDLPEDFFQLRHGRNTVLRLLHYPPFDQPAAEQQLRAGEHTDYGSITLLFQDAVGGLEICTRQGEWIAVPDLPGSILVNMGDAMQRWTNDRLRSTPHRVVNPVGELAKRSRYSAALFCDPNPDVEIACLETCQTPDAPPLYPTVRFDDYLQQKFAATY
jgi:isopenicillin N synthase-like dioxygenase